MISLNGRELLDLPISNFIISSEKVAHVQSVNNAEHALLVLTKTGYSSIPVLDMKYRLQGLLSTKMITESILGLESIEYEKLADLKVHEVMDTNVAVLIEKIFHIQLTMYLELTRILHYDLSVEFCLLSPHHSK